VTLAVLGLVACSSSSAPPAPLGVIADSGFRPMPNGLPFANYGGQLADGSQPTNLTVAEMQRLFGNTVCADAASGKRTDPGAGGGSAAHKRQVALLVRAAGARIRRGRQAVRLAPHAERNQ